MSIADSLKEVGAGDFHHKKIRATCVTHQVFCLVFQSSPEFSRGSGGRQNSWGGSIRSSRSGLALTVAWFSTPRMEKANPLCANEGLNTSNLGMRTNTPLAISPRSCVSQYRLWKLPVSCRKTSVAGLALGATKGFPV